MTISISTIGTIPYNLSPGDQFQVTIDISTWLDSDTINSVAFTAEDAANTDATATVIDSNLSTYTDTQIRAYIKGGVNDTMYRAECAVTTANGDKKSFYIHWLCYEQ